MISSALRRPLVTTTAAIAVIGASAAGFATTQGQAAPASFTVSSEAVAQSADLHRTSLEDRAYLAKSKNAGSQRAAALAEHTRLAAIARAEKVRKAAAAARAARIERARQAAAAKAARAAQQAAERRDAAARAARSQARTALAARASADPRSVARAMLGDFGWGEGQFGCLDSLWMKESGWSYVGQQRLLRCLRHPAVAAGLEDVQRRPPTGSTNPATQIKWGLGYIQERYGSPCAAWGHSPGHRLVLIGSSTARTHRATRTPRSGAAGRCRRQGAGGYRGGRVMASTSSASSSCSSVRSPAATWPRDHDHVADGAALGDGLLGHGGGGLVADVAVQRGDDGRRRPRPGPGSAPRRPRCRRRSGRPAAGRRWRAAVATPARCAADAPAA